MQSNTVIVWSGSGICRWWLKTSTLSLTVAAAFSDRQPTGYVVPRTHNTFRDRSSIDTGPWVWNNLWMWNNLPSQLW